MSVRSIGNLVATIALFGAATIAANDVEAAGIVDAPGIRAAVFYSIDGPGIVRSKGVEKVTNPALGVYCVKIKSTKIKSAKRTIPIISIETDTSKGSGATTVAVVATGGVDCPNPKRWITVKTFESAGGATDDGSWNLIVP